MNVSKAYDKILDEYEIIYGNNPEYPYFLDQFTATVKKGKVLELGCGTGDPVAKELVKRGYDVVGVDCSRRMIETANENVEKAVFILGDMRDLELEPESYDGICALQSFIHLRKKELEKLMAKLYEALKPGGAILVSVREGELDGKSSFLGEPMYMHEFSEDEIKILLHRFSITLFDRREFKPSGEEQESHLFIMGVKPDPQEEEDMTRLIKEEKPRLGDIVQDDFETLLAKVVSSPKEEKDDPLFSFYEAEDRKEEVEYDDFCQEIQEPKRVVKGEVRTVEEKKEFRDLLDQLLAEADDEPEEPDEEEDDDGKPGLDDADHPLNQILGEEEPGKKSKKQKDSKKKSGKGDGGFIRIRFGA